MLSYQEGNEEAFRTLYGRYSGRVYGFLRKRMQNVPRENVDDVLQAVFEKLHGVRHQFKKGNFFGSWLFSITKTTMIDYLRKEKRLSLEVATEDLDDVRNFEYVVSKEVDLSGLPEPQRKILEMRYFESKEFDEIAKDLNSTPENIRQQVSRAVRKLRKEIGTK